MLSRHLCYSAVFVVFFLLGAESLMLKHERTCFDQWRVIGSDRRHFRAETGENLCAVLHLPHSGCWRCLSQIPFAGWCTHPPAAERVGQSSELSLLSKAERTKSRARWPGSSPTQPGITLGTYLTSLSLGIFKREIPYLMVLMWGLKE